ncbi:DUF6452 family protein [Halpernia frigidisoli]|uniref:Lipoprotein n=1 Tax=Halpernia frigidisoli TaxID=1125876 RepID=A0A1I3GQV3_9FLAO|nr:DUF6452 family protein [Halpernia frigidisoli]SFI25820.1 hypothetical protein SAMN05443292_1976 [Halpernia frigidisoli]
MKKIFLFSLFSLVLFSCGSEDDICTSGEGTPRIKIKFKTQANNKLKSLDSIFVSADLGSGVQPVLAQKFPTDSIVIPLRVDDAPYTDIYVSLASKVPAGQVLNVSKIRINYTTKSQYVSPACGIKKTYENLNSVLINPNPVLNLEQTQTQITNEAKTSLYLIF